MILYSSRMVFIEKLTIQFILNRMVGPVVDEIAKDYVNAIKVVVD